MSAGEAHAKSLFQFEKEDIFLSVFTRHLAVSDVTSMVSFLDIYIMI